MRALPTCVALICLALAGCSDDDSSTAAPLPECPGHDYDACDIRVQSCQARMLALAACVYGAAEAPSVPVHLLSEQEFRDELKASLAESAQERTEEDVAATELLESALVDLRLAERGALSDEASIDTLVESFAGLYLDAESGIVLVDHGKPQNTPEADALLLHEQIHALQDADYQLDSWFESYRDSTDTLLAARAVTEGEATFYQFRVGLSMYGHRPETVDYEATFENLRADLDAQVELDPSPYVASAATFPYGYGATPAFRGWLARGQGFERTMIEAPPRSTLELLVRMDDDSAEAPPPEELAEPEATADFALLDHDVLGAWMLQMLLVKFDVTRSTALNIAKTWRGDHLWLYRDADDRRAWLWQLSLSSGSAADDMAKLIKAQLPDGLLLERHTGRLFIAAGAPEPPAELVDAGRAFLGRL